jgi:hypothetical protein
MRICSRFGLIQEPVNPSLNAVTPHAPQDICYPDPRLSPAH